MKTLTNPYLATLLLAMTAQSAAAERLVDPTRPANAKSVAAAKSDTVRLEAILQSDGARVAIVNGRLVRPGDRVGAAQIQEILPNAVRFSRDGRTHTAYLQDKALRVRQNVAATEGAT